MNDRSHGSLARIEDTERRGLRPIGSSAYEVACRTGDLLGGLLGLPGIRFFEGVRVTGHPPLPYAFSAESRVVLVDAVAWPPGCYATSAAGAVYCDDVYIGQTARPLLGAVRRLRRLQPRGHRVSGVVVVHASLPGRLVLPAALGSRDTGVAWVQAADAVAAVRSRLRSRTNGRVSSRAVEALAADAG